jgi:hypothetical protein
VSGALVARPRLAGAGARLPPSIWASRGRLVHCQLKSGRYVPSHRLIDATGAMQKNMAAQMLLPPAAAAAASGARTRPTSR